MARRPNTTFDVVQDGTSVSVTQPFSRENNEQQPPTRRSENHPMDRTLCEGCFGVDGLSRAIVRVEPQRPINESDLASSLEQFIEKHDFLATIGRGRPQT